VHETSNTTDTPESKPSDLTDTDLEGVSGGLSHYPGMESGDGQEC